MTDTRSSPGTETVLCLMLASSCFGCEVCPSLPCACAETLAQLHGTAILRDALEEILKEVGTSTKANKIASTALAAVPQPVSVAQANPEGPARVEPVETIGQLPPVPSPITMEQLALRHLTNWGADARQASMLVAFANDLLRGVAQGAVGCGAGLLETNPALFDILNSALGTMHYHRLMSALNWNGYQIVRPDTLSAVTPSPAQPPRTPLDLSAGELNTLATDAFREAAQGSAVAWIGEYDGHLDTTIYRDTMERWKALGRKITPLYAVTPSPGAGSWTPDQFWEYVGDLAGEFEAGQMRDMLAAKGLSITSATRNTAAGDAT